jgi:uncharacterized protein (DUF1810 family)
MRRSTTKDRRDSTGTDVLSVGGKKMARSMTMPKLSIFGDGVQANMSNSDGSSGTDDPHDLSRFVRAQQNDFEQALSEITSGKKRTHWMWYIFPQVDGLAFSSTSKHYSIKSIEEAKAYLDHPVLGPRLLECAQAVVRVEGRSATEIFGSPDDVKLRSSATLFAYVLPLGSVFDRLLEKYFHGEPDRKTLRLLGVGPEIGEGAGEGGNH